MRVIIGINGWLIIKDDIMKLWWYFFDDVEVFVFWYELEVFEGFGKFFEEFVNLYVWNIVKMEILKCIVLVIFWGVLWLVYFFFMVLILDNLFFFVKNWFEKVGEVLVDVLINKV